MAMMTLHLTIPKFEYEIIEDVDPVDPWAIIGAIGGVWREFTVGTRAGERSI